MPVKRSKKSGEGMKVERDGFLIDNGFYGDGVNCYGEVSVTAVWIIAKHNTNNVFCFIVTAASGQPVLRR